MRFPRTRVNYWLAGSQYDLAVWLQDRRRTARLGVWLENAQRVLVEVPLRRGLCLLLGHLPDRDQCGLPEHDYCVWCMKLMPYSWLRP